jgi:hypothetical protein
MSHNIGYNSSNAEFFSWTPEISYFRYASFMSFIYLSICRNYLFVKIGL